MSEINVIAIVILFWCLLSVGMAWFLSRVFRLGKRDDE